MNEESDLTASEFLLATRVQYEENVRRGKRTVVPRPRVETEELPAHDVEPPESMAAGELTAPSFLLATRTQREATERVVRKSRD